MRIYPSVEQLNALKATVDAGSFSGAARMLGRDRTSVSETIANLELDLGFLLFDRSGRMPVPLPAALRLAQSAELIIHQLQGFTVLSQEIFKGVEEQLTIGHDVYFPHELAVRVNKTLRLTFPSLQVHWLEYNRTNGEYALKNNDIDLLIGMYGGRATAGAFKFTQLRQMPYVIVASQEHEVVGNIVTFERLQQHNQLLFDDALKNDIMKNHVVSLSYQRIGSVTLFRQLLLAGEGWAMLPHHLVADLLASEQLVSLNVDFLNEPPHWPLVMLWREDCTMGPAMKLCLDVLYQ